MEVPIIYNEHLRITGLTPVNISRKVESIEKAMNELADNRQIRYGNRITCRTSEYLVFHHALSEEKRLAKHQSNIEK